MAEPRLCSVCHKPVPPTNGGAAFRPFCSPRCKKIDLGGWLDGSYRISRPLSEEEMDQGASHGVSDDGEGGRSSGGDA